MKYIVYGAIAAFGAILAGMSFEQGNQVGLVMGVICFLAGMAGIGTQD